MLIERLTSAHEAALEESLQADPVQNLFLLGLLEQSSLSQCHWYGVVSREQQVLASVVVIPGRLAVTWSPDRSLASSLGRTLRPLHRPTMVVGPRAASDALWAAWAPDAEVSRWYDQRLYLCKRVDGRSMVPGFRLATPNEWPEVAQMASAMELEDLGQDPAAADPALHQRVVRQRIDARKTWVIEREGALAFVINVGTTNRAGAQVGGTYVPPAFRGQGLATAGMRAVTEQLLRAHPMVTLHVNEANAPAVRCYERAGYVRSAPFRLLTLP